MHQIGGMLKLDIDGGSDLGVGVSGRLRGVELKLGGRRSSHTMQLNFVQVNI